MSGWDTLAARMDATVDATLGDDIEYKAAGAGAFVIIKGFVEIIPETGEFGEQDETLGTRKRVKVAKSIIADPTRPIRLKHPKLGAGEFQPAGAEPDDQGRYWRFDVQKA